MTLFSKIALITPAVIGAAAVTLMSASPADAQSRYRDRDDNTGRDAVIGAVVGGLAGALIGQGDGTYIAGGALAGAALGATASNNGSDCGYYRGGRCYRNQGHWEREHGINSRDSRWDRGDYRDYRDDRRDRRDYRREYRRDRRDDHRDNRDYRYDRRW